MVKTTLSTLVTAALLLTVTAGCSSDDTRPTPSAVPDPTSSPSEGGTEVADPAPAVVTLDFATEGKIAFSCTPFFTYVQFEQFSSDTDIELVSITAPGAVDAEVVRSWISDDPDQLNSGGILATQAKGNQITDEPGWDGRQRVAGYEIEAGTDYTVFVELSIRPGARIDDLVVTYLLDGVEGTTTWADEITRKRRCPTTP